MTRRLVPDPTTPTRAAQTDRDTTEDSYSVTRAIDGTPYYLMLTDTAGQEEYRGLWAASNLKSDAFLLVYDITAPNSLDALDYFMEMIDMEEENRIDNGKTPPVKMLAGNKCDLQGQRQIKAKDGLEWARKRKCGFMETSAREMVNIEETFARKSLRDSGHGSEEC
jgi:GTPase KRas protein